MNRFYIVEWPHSSKLIEQSWYYECFNYEDDQTYLVPEQRVIELFGKHHRFELYSERDEVLKENSYHSTSQYRIEFDED